MDGWERLRREWLEMFPSHGKTKGAGDTGEDSPGPPSENVTDPDAIRLWRSVVLRWQREVESSGARFTVVSLPPARHVQHALASLPDSVETLSLWDCFRSTVSDPPPRHMLRFENDSHWNEAANMVAAHCLYRFLEERLGLPPASDEALARERHRYYRAFAEAPDWEGGRWMPEPPWALPGAPSASGGGAIVEKYLALERSPARLDEHWRRVVRGAKAGGPLLRAAWDVYAAWDQRLLVYIKKPCRDEDVKPMFFFHLYPTNSGGGTRIDGQLSLSNVGVRRREALFLPHLEKRRRMRRWFPTTGVGDLPRPHRPVCSNRGRGRRNLAREQHLGGGAATAGVPGLTSAAPAVVARGAVGTDAPAPLHFIAETRRK